MNETFLLQNGTAVPAVGFGTWTLKGELCRHMTASALKEGYRLIDTAQSYQNEQDIAEGIRLSGHPRNDLFLTGKLSFSMTKTETADAIEKILCLLKTDYLDLLLLHEPFQRQEDMYEEMQKAVACGKIRCIGLSNFTPEVFRKFYPLCDIKPSVNQMESHVFGARIPYMKELLGYGICMQSYSSLCGGKGQLQDCEILKSIAGRLGKTPAQIALRYLIQKGIPVICRTKNSSRLRENLDLFSFHLEEEEIRQIALLDQNKSFYGWDEP